MPRDTSHLYWDLDTTKHEVARIYIDAQALAKAIEQLVSDFIERHSGDFEDTLRGINDSLSDLTDAAAADHLHHIERLERQINDIETADLRRNAPVVL